MGSISSSYERDGRHARAGSITTRQVLQSWVHATFSRDEFTPEVEAILAKLPQKISDASPDPYTPEGTEHKLTADSTEAERLAAALDAAWVSKVQPKTAEERQGWTDGERDAILFKTTGFLESKSDARHGAADALDRYAAETLADVQAAAARGGLPAVSEYLDALYGPCRDLPSFSRWAKRGEIDTVPILDAPRDDGPFDPNSE